VSPSQQQPAATLGASPASLSKGQRKGRTVDERISHRAATFFPLAASFCGDQGDLAGSKWSSARAKRKKGIERVVGKAAGDKCVFVSGEGSGWQMRRRHAGRRGR
jgi:hypothetical protein